MHQFAWWRSNLTAIIIGSKWQSAHIMKLASCGGNIMAISVNLVAV